MDSCAGRGKRHLDFNGQLLVEHVGLVDGLQRIESDTRQVAQLPLVARLGQRNGDVVLTLLLDRVNLNRQRRRFTDGGNTDAFVLQLAHELLEFIRADHLHRLAAIGANVGHEPQAAADCLLR